MFIRGFAFVWGANLLTLLLVSILIFFVNLTPPQEARRTAEPERLKEELTLIHDKMGPAGVTAFWQQIASAHPNFRLDQNATCGQPDTIGAAGEGCIRFVQLRSTDDIGPRARSHCRSIWEPLPAPLWPSGCRSG